MTRIVAGVVVAMDVELAHLLAQGRILSDTREGPWRVVDLDLHRRRVIAVRSSIGMVNAAAATEFLIARYAPPVVLNCGCAGAHRLDLYPGDVVVGTGSVPHGVLKMLPDGADQHMPTEWHGDDGRLEAVEFPSDERLVKLALAVDPATLPRWPESGAWPAGEPRRDPRVVAGPIASADIWTQAIGRMDAIVERHGTACEDMEAAAIAQIARRHGVPFLTVKDISNNERHAQTDLSEGWATLPEDEVGMRSALVLAGVIRRMSAN
jgi:adenosylhomocysteine nucleosidase